MGSEMCIRDRSYNSWGDKFVTLSVESDRGCIVTKTFPYEVLECCLPSVDNLTLDLITTIDPTCNGANSGVIIVDAKEGNPYFFNDPNDDPYYLFRINDGQLLGSSTFTGLSAGIYEIVAVDRLGCERVIEVELVDPPPIIVDAGPDITVNLGETADLDAFYTPMNMSDSIFWTPDSLLNCMDCLDPTVLPAGTTTYDLTVQNEDGCLDSDSITVFVTENRPLFIPNAFSPNFDGTNDFFNIFTGPAVDIVERMEIYDRWGDLIYRGENLEPNQANVGWDGTFRGKQMQPAVFAYAIRVRFIDNVVLLYDCLLYTSPSPRDS